MLMITAINLKGGVGKTVITKNAAYALACAGRRVLVIDADSDCCLTDALLGEQVPRANLSDVLTAPDAGADRAIVHYTGTPQHPLHMAGCLDVLPGSPDIARAAPTFLATRPRQPVQQFHEALPYALAHTSQSYDAVLIDPGPNWDAMTDAILSIVDGIIIPVVPEAMAIRSLKRLLTRITAVSAGRPARDHFLLGVVLSKIMSAPQQELARTLRGSLTRAGIPVFQTVIPFTDQVWQADGEQVPVAAYAPDNAAALAFNALAGEIREVAHV